MFIFQHVTGKVEYVTFIYLKEIFFFLFFFFFKFQDFRKVLQRNVVAYISLHGPVRGNSSLHSVASPSLQQLVAEVRWTTFIKCLCKTAFFSIIWHFLIFLFFKNTHKTIHKGFKEWFIPDFLLSSLQPMSYVLEFFIYYTVMAIVVGVNYTTIENVGKNVHLFLKNWI